MTIKDLAKSINQRLSNLAKDKQIGFPFIVTEFLIERLLARLVDDSQLREKLIFKGGFVALRQYKSPRYTVDLDAISHKVLAKNMPELIKSAIERDLNDAVWFSFQETVDLETQGEYGGIRFVFRAEIGEPLKDLKRAQILNLDIGFGDPVTPGPIKANLKPLLDTPELTWTVYPIETMIAEKLHALISRREFNSRSKDILDLSLFLPQADSETLRKAIQKTFSYRETDVPDDLFAAVDSIDLNILRKGWERATASVPQAPSFDEAFKKMLNGIKEKLL